MKNAVLNISVQVLVGVSASASFGKYLEMELLDYMIIQCSRFLEAVILLSTMVELLYISTEAHNVPITP